MTDRRTLTEVLQSTSDSIFPEEMGEADVDLDSAGVDGDTPLHVLIWRGDTEGVLMLLENGAPVNAVGDMGETPLHIAITKKDMRVIEALIKAGAKTDIVSEFGETPKQKAERKGIAFE